MTPPDMAIIRFCNVCEFRYPSHLGLCPWCSAVYDDSHPVVAKLGGHTRNILLQIARRKALKQFPILDMRNKEPSK